MEASKCILIEFSSIVGYLEVQYRTVYHLGKQCTDPYTDRANIYHSFVLKPTKTTALSIVILTNKSLGSSSNIFYTA